MFLIPDAFTAAIAYCSVVAHKSGDIRLEPDHFLLQAGFELWLHSHKYTLYSDDLLVEIGPEVAKCIHLLKVIHGHLNAMLLEERVALLCMYDYNIWIDAW